MRSNSKLSVPLPSPDEELDYCQSLNKGLPEDIRILGWTDLKPDVSARQASASKGESEEC